MEYKPYIPKSWNLPESISVRLGHGVGRQRLIMEEQNILLLLHDVPQVEDDERRNAVVFWRNAQGEWRSAPKSGGLTGLEQHIEDYRKVIYRLDDEVEMAKHARQYFEVMRHCHPLQRATRGLHEVLQELRERSKDKQIISLRDQAADLERAVELVVADARAGMDFTIAEAGAMQAKYAEAANIETRRLNRLAAFFFPLVTLVSVFGMNPPEAMLESEGFWFVLAAGIVLGIIVYVVVAKRNKE